MGRIIWTEPALADVQEIVEFIARDSRRYAEQVAAEIVETSQRLLEHPRIGWRVPEFDDDSIRELLCNSFRVIYSIRGQDCILLAIVHASRDLAALLQRRGM